VPLLLSYGSFVPLTFSALSPFDNDDYHAREEYETKHVEHCLLLGISSLLKYLDK